MYSLSKKSLKHYDTLDPRLQLIIDEVLKIYDISIICGARDKEAQNKAFKEGRSKLIFPNSKHNSNPSKAVDIAPYPIDWLNRDKFFFLIGIIYTIANRHFIKIRSGSNWAMDWQFGKQKFDDLVHIELVG